MSEMVRRDLILVTDEVKDRFCSSSGVPRVGPAGRANESRSMQRPAERRRLGRRLIKSPNHEVKESRFSFAAFEPRLKLMAFQDDKSKESCFIIWTSDRQTQHFRLLSLKDIFVHQLPSFMRSCYIHLGIVPYGPADCISSRR